VSFLINRNPSGRIICLHALLGSLYIKYGKDPFTLNGLKFDSQSKYNIHQRCTLLTKLPSISFKVCPYLQNPLSDAKCYLTQSVQEDKQKSKSASDAFNALEGMGFIRRSNKKGIITDRGISFISETYNSIATLEKIKEGLLSYGPFVGLLFEILRSPNSLITRNSIKLGYPITNEKIKHKEKIIILSSGSQKDTIIRTRSVMFIWAITGGFILPENVVEPIKKNNWHVDMLDYIKKKTWKINKFKIITKNIFSNKIYVKNPLSFSAMTKRTRALRERNQEAVRNLTIKFEPIIKNRRFAIVYILALKSEKGENLNFIKLIKELTKYPDLFIINKKSFDIVMDKELEIANVTGIPFERQKDILIPKTKLNIFNLKNGAPNLLINILEKIEKRI